MSQQTNAGLSAPGLSVCACEPDGVGPKRGALLLGRIPKTTSTPRLKSEFPASGFCAIGVGHVAGHTILPNKLFSGTFGCGPPSFQSRLVGVGHVKTIAASSFKSRPPCFVP